MLARYLLFPLLSFRYVAAWHCWENEKPERTVVAFSMVLLWFVMQALGPVLSFVETLSQFSGFEHLGTVFKAVAIALMAQSVQDLCMEAGQTALAGRVELAGKVAVLLVAMPLFTVLTDTLLALLR